MSETNDGFEVNILAGLSSVLSGLCDGDVSIKINDLIENLINTREVKSLLEDKDVTENNVKKCVENFNTLKLLLQIVKGKDISRALPVGDILQSIRDLFDGAVEIPNFPDGFPFNLLLDVVVLIVNHVSQKPEVNDILSLANFYQYNLHMIKIKHVEELINDNTKELVLRLQIISRMLDSFLKHVEKENPEDFIYLLVQQIKEAEIPGSIQDSILFSRLVIKNSHIVATQTLLGIIPVYIKYSKSREILQLVWEQISEDFENFVEARPFLIICHLLNFYFGDQDLAVNMFEDEKYWILIQKGLTNKDPLIRKQALFLFKKAVEEMSKNECSIACRKRDELNVINFDQKLNDGVLKLKNGMKNFMVSNSKIFLVYDSKNVMWWDPTLKKELCEVYSKIFSVIECLEEKQSHIIKPVFEIVEDLIENSLVPFTNGKNINISWMIVIFQRIVSHDNVSIVKWGILKLMKIPLNIYPNEEITEAVIKLLVKSLSRTTLYVSGCSISNELKIFFQSCVVAGSSTFFFKTLLKEICGLTWSPEALYFVVSALATVKTAVWEEDEILKLKKFFSTSMATHYTYMKSGIQYHLLKSIINLTDTTNIKLEMIISLLGSFGLKKGTKMWNEVVTWIEYCYSKRNAEEFILKFLPYEENKSLDEKSVGKGIVLLYDAHLFGIMKCCGETPSCEIINALSILLSSFKNIDKRLYVDRKIINYNLSILYYILNENLNEGTRLIEMMLSFLPDIIFFVQRQSKSIDLADFHTCELYIKIFENILKAQQLYKVDSAPFIGLFYSEIVNNLEVENNSLQKYIEIKILKLILDYVYNDKMTPNLKYLQSHFKKFANKPLTKSDGEAKNTKDLQVLWGKINSEYLEAKWYILERLTNEVLFHVSKGSLNVGKFVSQDEIFLLSLEALEIGGYSVLVPVMSVLKDALLECEDASALKKIAHVVWNLILERRKSDNFRFLMEKFMEIIFQREFLVQGKEDASDVLLEYSKRIFAETTSGLPNILLKQVQKIGVKYNPNPVFCYILASGLLFGPVQRKDELLIVQVCSEIEALNMTSIANDWCYSSEIRARSVQIVLTLDQTVPDHQRFIIKLIAALQDIAVDISKSKNRYFGDSYIHRVKHRLLQSLLLLEPYLPEEKAKDLFRWLCDSAISENHQPSVRYQQEWLSVRLLYKYPHLQDSFWNYFDEALEKRTGSLCSFISIAFHLCKVLPSDQVSSWIDRSMQQFLPYCMAQHFSIRLYAQVTLQKLWELANRLNINDVVNKYQIISNCLIRSIENGNAVKNCVKLQEDFYFTVFDSLAHYSIQTIYTDLPRLANVGSSEWISNEIFKSCGVSESSNKIPLKNPDDLLERFNDSKWELRETFQISEENDESTIKSNGINFQKKMIPAKSMGLEYDELFNASENVNQRKGAVKKDGLIVVASLIDRIPNLGGLARTCEVFGVSEYVLGSLKYAEDKQFQSLSVTAEKWISITEVKPFYLADYLIRMKQKGYTILGAEQTAKSQPLSSVKFPEKSLLLLGNEKEGIPPELIPLLDVCIEIPQFGMVRSLNVHVTGALFIYEYAKQHVFSEH